MKKNLFLLGLSVFLYVNCFAGNIGGNEVHIIPEPVSVKVTKGVFSVGKSTRIIASSDETTVIATMLRDMLQVPTGFHIAVKNAREVDENAIILKLNSAPDERIGKEGYTLDIQSSVVLIKANTARGLFYGVQTLMQLLPPSIGSASVVNAIKWKVPCVNIVDYPRFHWRGLMLDVSRHFFSKAVVMRYIDEMAKYKFNVFHMHLSDDAGWRVEIKGLPKLTEVGAWRVPRTGRWGEFTPPQKGEKATEGGFYTQEDIREIVAYAQKKFITIVPEFDMPAHSLALIASYPNLSCTQLQYSINPGAPFDGDDELCVANDSVWMVIDKIFTQVAKLFPGEYIHVGGDEASRKFWKECPKDQALMKKEGITNVEGLQSYFEKKLEKIIISKGKKMIGWDEILEGGLAKEATVMSWRGMKGGVEAAKMGHHVIMTPTQYCYLDMYQGDPLIEPLTYSKVLLSTCYQFEPVPNGVDPTYIMGGQGNLWTESVPTERHAAYMTWPRGFALSEVLWSPKEKRNWNSFISRMEYRFQYLDAEKVKYSRSVYDPVITGTKDADGELRIKLATEIKGLDIYYTFDGTNPDNFYPLYRAPLNIPKGASEIRVVTYRNGSPIGHQINCPLKEVANRIEK